MIVRHLTRIITSIALAATFWAGDAAAQPVGIGSGFTIGGASSLVNESARAVERRDWEAAVRLADEALHDSSIMMSPKGPPAAYNNLCIGYIGLAKFNEAIAACDKAVELDPRRWSFYNNRANIYFHLGQFDRALAEYYKAMAFNTSSRVLIYNIGITLDKRRRRGPIVQERTS